MPEKKSQIVIPDKPQSTSDLISETSIASAADIQSALKGSAGKPVDVVGQEVDPEIAYQNLEEALEHVRGLLDFDSNNLYFQKFFGDTVGEALEDRMAIDPIMLMHPAARLAHVIAHEKAHMGGKIDNEALVESFVRTLDFVESDGATLTDKYTAAMENFHTFIERISEGKPIKEVVKRVYNLYYNEKFDAIYDLYVENYIQTLKSEEEKDAAYLFFKTVFPELEVTDAEFSTEKVVTKAKDKYDDMIFLGENEGIGDEEHPDEYNKPKPPTVH